MGINRGILFVALSLAALVLAGSALLVFALRRAPLGVETEEGFHVISPAVQTESGTPAAVSDHVEVFRSISKVSVESDPQERKTGNAQ